MSRYDMVYGLRAENAILRSENASLRAEIAEWRKRGVEAQKCYEIAREKLAEMVACQDQLNKMHDAEIDRLAKNPNRIDQPWEKIGDGTE